MTITVEQAQKLRRYVRQLVRAEVDHSWKGSDRAEAFADYDEHLRVARQQFNTFVGGLIHGDKEKS